MEQNIAQIFAITQSNKIHWKKTSHRENKMKIERKEFESYEDALSAIRDYSLYIQFGNKGIGLKASHNLERNTLDISFGLIKLN